MADFPAAEFQLDGEPSAIRRSAHQWSAFGTAATDAASQIRSLDSSLFIGPEGDQYREGLNHDLPPHLNTTGQAYTNVATALGSYADTLNGLQDRMAPLRVKAPALWEALQQAHGRITTAQSADHQHQLQTEADPRSATPGQPTPPDPYHSDLGGASASLSAAQRAWDDCLTAARAVRADLRTAVDAADRGIQEAAALRFTHNPHGFGALVAGFKDFVKDHAQGLAKLSGALKIVSGVAALLAFIPVVGEAALLVSALAAGTALAIDASIKFATGKGSWTSIAVDGALLALPFGIGKGIQALRGARGAEAALDAGDGIVKFRPPRGANPAETAQVQRYVEAAERARADGRLAPTGRVSTQGDLRRAASQAARRERVRAQQAGTPYQGHVGHAPDTTWTGEPVGYEWHDQTPKVNSSLGSQATRYPVGFKPSKFEFDPTPIGQ